MEDDPQNGTVIRDFPFGKWYTENTWWQGALSDDVIKAAIIMAENLAVSNADTLTEYMTPGLPQAAGVVDEEIVGRKIPRVLYDACLDNPTSTWQPPRRA